MKEGNLAGEEKGRHLSVARNCANRPVLSLLSVNKEYKEGGSRLLVLNNVNVEILPGEFVVLVGPSGSGKSTLLNIISGIDSPTTGEVIFYSEKESLNLTAMDEQKRTLFRRANIGFIFQFFNLIPTLTVWENVLLPLELNNRLNEEEQGRASDLLGSVGMGDRRDSFPDHLSGGEQQRVAIARALAHDPGIILADEPTGNLDAENGAKMMDMLDQLTRRSGKTLVMVTHSQEIVSRADRVLRMRSGRVVESDRPGPSGALS